MAGPARRSLRGALLIAVVLGFAAFASNAHAEPPAVTEFQLPTGGSTHELTMGPDGNVWVTQQKQAHLVRITPKGRQRVYSLPKGSGPHGIDFNRRGRLWLTLEFANTIAKLDRSGHIMKRYPIPRSDAGPHGLHVARNGLVWWTGKTGNVVGNLDPRTGRMHVFTLPTANGTPIYIAEGCDGMYFTELTGARIGRVTDDGTITEWATPTHGSRPIAVAPRDCRVWFSEEAGHHVAIASGDELRGVSAPRRVRLPARPDASAYQRARWCSITPSPPTIFPTPGKDPASVPNVWR